MLRWSQPVGIIMTKFVFWVWLQAITTRNRLSSQSPLKFLMKMIIIYFYSACQVELCLQTCVGYSEMLRLGQPVGIIMRKIWIWTLITSNDHKKSCFKPTSSQISHEDHYHLLWKCLPGWVLSLRYALSSLTCSDGANRLELSWPNF